MIQYPKYNYAYISTGATTQVYSGNGTLHSIVVNGGTTGTIIVYDETGNGTTNIIASFDTTNALSTFIFDVGTSKGLKIITSAATKLTVSYQQ